MSRFTRAPFHKPSPFDIPRPVHPLSPPETDITTDSVQLPPMNFARDGGSYAELAASSSYTRVDTPESYHTATAPVDTHAKSGPSRRPSNLAYLHPGSLRSDLRAPRAVTRYLVMVIPPPAVAREHGTGVFLNASAHNTQGVLLPLLPSLSSQLSAIAREFSFPSTTGICVYLQMADGGVQFSLRVSDESWSILWGGAFDERNTMNTIGGLPIAARIEFDLDLRKARWFDMWLTSLKHAVDLGPSVNGSIAAGHRRDDSRTTFDHIEDSMADDVSVTIQRKVPVVKHIPRKLSLLDRIDVSTIKPPSRSVSRALSPVQQPTLRLSPVAQTPVEIPVPVTVEDEEPQTARRRVDVEKKVQNWRASSSFAKSPLVASTGQVALDPTNMPNNQPLVESDSDGVADPLEPLNLDDFAWSISSAGPLSAEFDLSSAAYVDSYRAPSVHLEGRLEGSVCLTPTTCTSYGPLEYEAFSPVESLISRLPSPDIAARQFEDAPLTPSTATSWGPPSEWPESPAVSERALSVDLAARHFESRPATPSTATSWGVPAEWPTSPASPFYVHTPGVGNMFFDDEEEETALLERGRVLRSYGAGDEEPHRSLSEDDYASKPTSPWQLVWPYRLASVSRSWQTISVHLEATYPCLSVYRAVYPHFDLYPAHSASLMPRTTGNGRPPPRKEHSSPSHHAGVPLPFRSKPWSCVWPYRKASFEISGPIITRLEVRYPSFDLYPVAYPHFDLYPAKPVMNGSIREVNVKLDAKYPIISLYSAVYPNFEIYPGHVVEEQADPGERLSVRLQPGYPCIQPYPPVYPHFDLYPVVKASGNGQTSRNKSSPLHASTSMPPRKSVWGHVWPYQQAVEDAHHPIVTRIEAVYPSISLYPAVYPYFDLYPAKFLASDSTRQVSVKLEARYPSFSIYAVVYPSFEIYPGQVIAPQTDPREALSVKLSARYPSFEIYSPVYPHLVIYPGDAVKGKRSVPKNPVCAVFSASRPIPVTRPSPNPKSAGNDSKKAPIPVTLKPAYPLLEIYAPVYPHLQVYPSLPSPTLKKTLSTTFEARYPNLVIYPVVYPFFDISQSGKASTPEYWREAPRVALDAKYPMIEIYAPVYPFFDIYQSGKACTPEHWREAPRVALAAKYPMIETYAPVYPFFDIYNSGHVSNAELLSNSLSTKMGASYPVFDIYPAVYPNFELYPCIRPVMHDRKSVRPARKSHGDLVDRFAAQDIQSTAPRVPRISVSSHPTRQRSQRTHAELVERVLSEEKKRVLVMRPPEKVADVPRDVGGAGRPLRSAMNRQSTVPLRPSGLRRSVSLAQNTMSSSFTPGDNGLVRTRSLRQLPPVGEETTAIRPGSVAQRVNNIAERKPFRRDSIVLEKARYWGASGPEPTRQRSDSAQVTMKDLADFPMPPVPPLVNRSTERPVSSVNRPIAKLDRTKFPFR